MRVDGMCAFVCLCRILEAILLWLGLWKLIFFFLF